MSEEPYTPTTAEVRDYFAHGQFSDVTDREAVAAFNRWFAAEIAKAQAEAVKGLLPAGAEHFPIEGGIVYEGKMYYPTDYVLTRNDIEAIRVAAIREGEKQ